MYCTNDLSLLVFLGEIGGYMGLLIGASMLTLCEILDLFVHNLILKCVNRVKGGGKKKTSRAGEVTKNVMMEGSMELYIV